MKVLLFSCLLISIANFSFAQKPKDGTYTYTMVYTEFVERSLDVPCIVVIKGDSIKIINSGKGSTTGKKGDIIEEGIIMKHKSGKWIIGKSPEDKNADEIGGCTDGPSVIDFKRKKYLSC